jgi:hypothetical protein
MAKAMQAADTFVAVLDDGTERHVRKGEVLADSHELVKRDVAAAKDNPGRAPLFRPLDLGDEDEDPKPARKLYGAAAASAAAKADS